MPILPHLLTSGLTWTMHNTRSLLMQRDTTNSPAQGSIFDFRVLRYHMEYFRGCSGLSKEHLQAAIASWNTTWFRMFLQQITWGAGDSGTETFCSQYITCNSPIMLAQLGVVWVFFPLIITLNLNSTCEKAKKRFKLFYFWKIFFFLLLPSYFKGHHNYIHTLWSWRSQKHYFKFVFNCCILRICNAASYIFIWRQLISAIIKHILRGTKSPPSQKQSHCIDPQLPKRWQLHCCHAEVSACFFEESYLGCLFIFYMLFLLH